MSPYRTSEAPPVTQPRGIKQWWRCYILRRHVWSDCPIQCAFFECFHKKCSYCGHVDPLRYLPEDEPHHKDLFASLRWSIGCAHDWKTVTLTRGHVQQCTRCPETRPHRFPAEAP